MLAREFVYWLQGFFEITSSDSDSISLTVAQVDKIEAHIKMVREADWKCAKSEAHHFISWLNGFLLGNGPHDKISVHDKHYRVSAAQSEKIKDRLTEIFHREIDSSYGDSSQQALLQEIHDTIKLPSKPPLPSPINPTQYRC